MTFPALNTSRPPHSNTARRDAAGGKVSAYSRTITEAFGRDISPKRIDVSAYSRIANIEARVYLRGGLADVEAEAAAELQQVIDQSAKAFNDDA